MERVLAIKLADVGDVLTITPALRALRERFPAARLSVLATPGSCSVLQGNPHVDEVIPFDKLGFDRVAAAFRPAAIRQALQFGLALRARRFDRVVLLHHLFTRWGRLKYAALMLATGAPVRLGLADRRPWFLTEAVSDGGFGARHEVEHWLALVGAWGATTADRRLELPLCDGDRAAAGRWLGERPSRPLVALAPGSGPYSSVRRWPAARFGKVARRLAAEQGASIVIGGARDEVALAHQVAQAGPPGARVLAGLTSVREWAAVLEQCDLLVTNDSGAGHLAAAVGTPVVSVFGPSNDRAWRPWDGGARTVEVVASDLACRPCFYVGRALGRREGCGDPVCLTQLAVDRVAAAALRRLAARSQATAGAH